MMTVNKARRMPWANLARSPKHRTSRPTDDLMREFRIQVGNARGSLPYTDAVLLAALRLLDTSGTAGGRLREADLRRLVVEVDKIEKEAFEVREQPGE